MTRKVRSHKFDPVRPAIPSREIYTKAFTLAHRMKDGISMLCGHEEEIENDDLRGPCLSLGGGAEPL